MNPIFTAILNEAVFTKEMLATGATQIRKGNYAEKGYYFQAFTSLSTGIERIGKLCFIFDYFLHNGEKFPSQKYLKNEIGHDLLRLYIESEQIVCKNSIQLQYLKNLRNPIHHSIIEILSNFARGDRYTNLDFLLSGKRESDPIQEWSQKVDNILFTQKVTAKKKAEIEYNSRIVEQMLEQHSIVLHMSESNAEITSLQNASYLTGVNASIVGLRQLYVAQIIRYWVELLSELNYKAMSLSKMELPHLGEIFSIFYNGDDYLKTRKNFERN